MLKNKLGSLKTFLNRLIGYLGIINFIMILYLFVKNEPFGLKWYLWFIIIIIISLFVVLLDSLFIIEQEGTYIFKRNPKLMEMENDIKKILEILKE